ncbi:MAG: SpoIIE family protein phosphatase [Bacteroidetes bacterium]|nr:SpoIIE family protein phosphatase [Bacteroidota bacterium]
MEQIKILIVEDQEADAEMIKRFLAKQNIAFSILRVWQEGSFVKALEEYRPDIIFSDCVLPQFSGIEAFCILRRQYQNIPFILISGSISEGKLAEYLKEGIDEYILKSNLLRLPSAIENVINKKKLERLNAKLDIANKRIESAYKDIKDSINYAQKIQSASLPNVNVLKDAFPGSFISYKPKDVLSGDFFWFKRKGNKFFIAVADCTGHGVPGALLSMMGSNLLHEIVNKREVSHPADILNQLNKGVRKILNHDKTSLQDGMDIVLCSIDLETNIAECAGANRPLYVVRKGEFNEIAADKTAIGQAENTMYANHVLYLEANDRIFLSTDGYADQFNDKSAKKISKKRLISLLTKSCYIPIDVQEQIINSFFDEWKGKQEQIDDVLLLGIEIKDPPAFDEIHGFLKFDQIVNVI